MTTMKSTGGALVYCTGRLLWHVESQSWLTDNPPTAAYKSKADAARTNEMTKVLIVLVTVMNYTA